MIVKHGHFIVASTLTVACTITVELAGDTADKVVADDNANSDTVRVQ